MTDRRRSSETNHIIRIRTANAKRKYIPWWLNPEVQSLPFISELEQKRKFSLDSELARRSKIESPDDSYEYQDPAKSIGIIDVSSNVSLKGLDKAAKVKFKKPVVTQSETITPGTIRSVKRFKKKTRGKQKDTIAKTNTTKSDKKVTASRQKPKSSRLKDRKGSITLKNDQKNMENVDTVSQSNTVDSGLIKLAQWLQDNIETSERPVTSKDMMVLKWLQGKIPKSGEGNDTEANQEIKKYTIHLLKGSLKPMASPLLLNAPIKSESKGARRKSNTGSLSKNVLSDEKRKKWNISGPNSELKDKKSYEQRKLHKPLSSESSADVPEKSEQRENNYLEAGNGKDIKFNETALFPKNDEVPPGAEMYVTELGKLHVILNTKSFNPDDAAVIIWLNEIPMSSMKPDYRKRLSITDLNDTQPLEKYTVLKSNSTLQLEDTATPKPDIYFPPVTVLKNLAVNSKGELRNLKDSPSAVLYKRCNLMHIDSVSPELQL